MKKMRMILAGICMSCWGMAQTYTLHTTNWEDAGYHGQRPVFTKTLNVLDYGADNTGNASCHTALYAAMSALGGKAGVIYFPPGTYHFSSSITVNRDSLLFKGAGADSTLLRFDLNGTLNHCFLVWGKEIVTDTTSLSQAAVKDSSTVNCLNPSLFAASGWVYLTMNDAGLMYSSWAYGSMGQVMQIDSLHAGKLYFRSPFRFTYPLNLRPRLKRLQPRHDVGFECLKIKRLDATLSQTSLISFDKAVNCWIEGIEGDSTNYAHVELNRSSNIDIRNSYFHHAMAYGGSGQGYGIVFQYSSNECRAESNIFRHLRHSLLFQAGANGNVCGYNYSLDPFWTEGLFPGNSAGDLVFHGNYVFANLAEGNILQNIVIDDSHGKNGPGNTLFRNRAELYGLYMNNAPATDNVQIVGNEITNTASGLGLYVLNGLGNMQYANIVKGAVVPSGTSTLNEASLYRSSGQGTLCLSGTSRWPAIGPPQTYNTGSIYARDRYQNGQYAVCSCTLTPPTNMEESTSVENDLFVYPMPVSSTLHIRSTHTIQSYFLTDISGRVMQQGQWLQGQETLDLQSLPTGCYILTLHADQFHKSLPLIKAGN